MVYSTRNSLVCLGPNVKSQRSNPFVSGLPSGVVPPASASTFAIVMVSSTGNTPGSFTAPSTLTRRRNVISIDGLRRYFRYSLSSCSLISVTMRARAAGDHDAAATTAFAASGRGDLAFFVQNKAQQRTTPNRTALIFSLEPFFAALFAYLLIGSALTGREWFGDKFSVLDPYGFVFYTWGVRRELPMGELKNYTRLLEETRQEAISRMIEQATAIGANAIVNVRFATSDVAAGAAEIYIYGTAVRAE